MKTMGEIIAKATRGDASAAEFLTALHQVVDLWDDLIDKDRPVSSDAINTAFYDLLVTLPRNAFYQRNFALLNPLIESAIIDWHTANALEASKQSMQTAYGLRCSGQAVSIMVARIVGGPSFAENIALELRSAGDTWADYAAKHGVQ